MDKAKELFTAIMKKIEDIYFMKLLEHYKERTDNDEDLTEKLNNIVEVYEEA